MKTYQDLLKKSDTEANKAQFCRDAVAEFMSSVEYAQAKAGEAYYNKHNLTIEAFQKYLYSISGRQVPDIFSSNYKLKTLFFRRLVTQQVQYVTGNGVYLNEVKNKAKLGKDFDYQIQLASKRAMAGGRAFGFWNYDHLEVFGFADTATQAGFCPLYNEDTAQLEAGIRYWFRQVGDSTLFRCTLYEADGYTEYRQTGKDKPEVLEEKRGYKRTTTQSKATGIESVTDENYTKLPIVPLYANDTHESELIGIRECIDCYDFIKSGLANDIDDTSGFYWILKNTGGMDDTDLAKFIQRMKTVKATVVDGDQGVDAEAHSLDVPVVARETMLELLRKDIYEDFQALDVNTLSASAKTTQEIQASYQNQDNKCADFEYYLIDFVQQILELAGIDDEPTFRWNRVVNQAEQTQMILQASNYLTDEVIVKHLPFLTPEEADIVIKDLANNNYDMFNGDEE
ncbi:MAG: phage portal protein [Paludibacteraceae bacterium]|nr:phage portal protein [Paludibacteraceae bacterium]